MNGPVKSPDIQRAMVPSPAALMVLDAHNRVVYHNSEAAKILTYPERIDRTRTADFLPEEIRSLLRPMAASPTLSSSTEVKSGSRVYMCRTFTLARNSGNSAQPLTALLMERVVPKSPDVSEIAHQYHLTQREQETVELLTFGFTSKEIAGRMHISPNTVKTFFRLVMTKMGVSTRAGIVGKIAHAGRKPSCADSPCPTGVTPFGG